MKIYHTETQEDYDALMVELDSEGITWHNGQSLTKDSTHIWNVFGNQNCIRVTESIAFRALKYFYEKKYSSIPIIKYKAKVDEKMKIYHTETQADYDALMVELEEQGIETLKDRCWKVYENQTVVFIHDIGRYGDSTITVTTYGSLKGWALQHYPDVPITKYKAKADEKMRFTKENVLNLTDRWIENKTVSFQDLQNQIKELDDTPEKVVVPKHFDDWYKEIESKYQTPDSAKTFALWKLCQQGFGCSFEDIRGKKIPYETDLGEWFENKVLAIDAVLNGYTIEPEKLYYIPLPHLELSDGTKQVLSKRKGYKHYFANFPTESLQQQFTKEELEQVPEIYKSYATPVEEEM